MKNYRITLLFVAMFILSISVFAQNNIVKVVPGYGTLNAAITANGSATYELTPGAWYGLDAPVQVSVPISIVGRDSAGMPAIIQTGNTSAGATFDHMFDIFSNITFKHVFIVNADLKNGLGNGVALTHAPGNFVMDSCVVDPTGIGYLYTKASSNNNTYVTNSLIMEQGNTLSVNDGHVFQNNTTGPWDTLYIENNTFVNVGTGFITSANFDRDSLNFEWINHNSFFFGKANFENTWQRQSSYITNNMMWQFDIHPIQYAWANFFPGGGPLNRVQALVYDDTLRNWTTDTTYKTETLPSQRKHFVEYNSNYRSQGFWDLINYINQQPGWAKGYLYDFIPDISFIDSCRETRMYNTKSSFPYFFYNNNISDYGAENKADDPGFTDQRIYQLTDSALAWATQSAYQVWGHQQDAPATWADYFYRDSSGLGNPTAWPRFNGAYTNSKLMTASIEKLPLGDLNWFPAAKATWQANQSKIMNYIESENESQMNLTGVKNENNQTPTSFSLSQNYPNPFNPSTVIKYSVPKSGMVTLKVYNMLGQEVATLVNQMQNSGNYIVNFNANKLASGVYMYRIQSGNFTLTKKMELLK